MSKSGGKDTTTNKKWVSYFDALRVIAAFAVIIIHVAARKWTSKDIDTTVWQASNFWDGVMRFAVPIFVMISGALMLNPEKRFSIKKLYSKNIVRLITAFAFWSLFYLLFGIIVLKQYHGIIGVVKDFVIGPYHLWFIYMIIGLYIATPVLRLITQNKKMTEYFLIVGLLLCFILPGIKTLCNGWFLATGNRLASNIVAGIGSIIGSMRFQFAGGYVLYYVLGYWLFSNETSKKMRLVYYILGIIGMVLTFYFGQKVSMMTGKKYNIFDERSIWILMWAIAIFVFAKYHLEKIGRSKIIKMIAPLSFGIYLLHARMIDMILMWIIKGVQFNYWTIPLIALVTFVASVVVILIISKIPILNKYIM